MNLIFLDTETTHKDETARLVQLAFKLHGDEACKVFYYKPPVAISFEAMATHHITEDMVEKLPSFEQSGHRDRLQALLNQNYLVAHNAAFDTQILKREGLEIKNVICTLKIAQNLFDLPMYKLQYLRYWAHLNVEGKAHDAEGDVNVLEAVFKYLFGIMRSSIPSDQDVLEKMLKITQDPVLLKRIGFGKYAGREFSMLPTDYLSWLRRQDKLEPDLVYTLDYYLKK